MREAHSGKRLGKSKRQVDHGDSRLSRRLASYAAAAGGTVALLGISDTADAKIVYTPVNITVSSSVPSYVIRPDGVHPAATLSFQKPGYHAFDLIGNGASGGEIMGMPASEFEGGYLINRLPAGEKVGSAATFGPGGRFAAAISFGSFEYKYFGKWFKAKSGTSGYFGFEFLIDGETHYGWGRLAVSGLSNNEVSGTLTGFAYETIPNRRILAGQEQGSYAEPEPGEGGPTAQAGPFTLGALALGAAGVPIWRKEEDA